MIKNFSFFILLFLIFLPQTAYCYLTADAWDYEVSVDIDNTSNSNALSDYQVLVTLNTQSLISDGKMMSQGEDIRFTNLQNDDSTFLDYWIETETINTASTYIWVKVGSIPASSTKTIYLYYGNNGATSYMDGDATFNEYINFNTDGVISYGGGQDAQSAQYELLDNNRTLRMYGNNWKATNALLTLNNDLKLDFSFKSTGVQGEINGIGLDTNTTDLASNWFYKTYGTQTWGANSTSPVYSESGDYERVGMVLNDFTGSFSYLVLCNDADAGQNKNVYYRDVRVRKYSSPEPTTTIMLPITQLSFTTSSQTIFQSTTSNVISVETQDETGSPQR